MTPVMTFVEGRWWQESMYANSTSLLCYTGDRSFDFFCGHYEVGKLIDYHHDVGEKTMAFLRVEMAMDELDVILADFAHRAH